MKVLKEYFSKYFFWMCLVSFVNALLSTDSLQAFFVLFLATFVVSQISCFSCVVGESFLFQRSAMWHSFWSVNGREHFRPLGAFIFLPLGLTLGFFIVKGVFLFINVDFFFYFPIFPKSPSVKSYFLGLISICLIVYVRYQAYSREKSKDLEIKMKNLELENLKSRLLALNLQMNPHFLFNTLHTLVSYIKEDPDKAENILIELSDLLRCVLLASEKEFHTLSEELKILSLYVSLEKVRFGEKFSFQKKSFDSSLGDELKIPVLILQSVVENALKYGLSETKHKVEIFFSVKKEGNKGVILIENDGEEDFLRKNGNSLALKNCRKRLELMFGDQATLELKKDGKWTSVSISIPYKKEAKSL